MAVCDIFAFFSLLVFFFKDAFCFFSEIFDAFCGKKRFIYWEKTTLLCRVV